MTRESSNEIDARATQRRRHHMIGWCAAAALLIALAGGAAVIAQRDATAEAKAKMPPALTEYMGRTIAHTMSYEGASWLTRPTRQQEENTKLMIEHLRLKPGDVACDLGCGNGYNTLKMAKIVGENGWVYGEDIQPQMLQMLNDRAFDGGVENVTPVLGTVIDPRLPAGKLDLVLMIDVYHEFDHPVQMLAQIRRSLKPTGRVVLVEYRLEDPNVPIKLLHKMSKKQVEKELAANGFKLVETFEGLPEQHMLFFQRDDAPGK